jgi:hypothetical protein
LNQAEQSCAVIVSVFVSRIVAMHMTSVIVSAGLVRVCGLMRMTV